VTCQGSKYRLEKGSVYLFPADTDFSYSCSSNLSKIYFHVNIFSINGYDMLSGADGIVFKNMDETIEEMRRLWQSKESLSAIAVKSILHSIIFNAARELGRGKNQLEIKNPLIEKTIKIIEDNLNAALTAKEIAEKLFVSESWLHRVFREEVGVTLGKYINDRVLFSAQETLRKSNCSVKEISLKYGYCDQFYFSRAFTARFGMSPIKYRKNVKT
jgi:AraC-like DNA-binding protein